MEFDALCPKDSGEQTEDPFFQGKTGSIAYWHCLVNRPKARLTSLFQIVTCRICTLTGYNCSYTCSFCSYTSYFRSFTCRIRPLTGQICSYTCSICSYTCPIRSFTLPICLLTIHFGCRTCPSRPLTWRFRSMACPLSCLPLYAGLPPRIFLLPTKHLFPLRPFAPLSTFPRSTVINNRGRLSGKWFRVFKCF